MVIVTAWTFLIIEIGTMLKSSEFQPQAAGTIEGLDTTEPHIVATSHEQCCGTMSLAPLASSILDGGMTRKVTGIFGT